MGTSRMLKFWMNGAERRTMFGFLIFIHELGHFLTAKWMGVQVNEFAVCMGPAIFKKQRGETTYSLRCIPIGGYCAMLEKGTAQDEEELRNFNRVIVQLGEELGKPVCATGDVHFLNPEDEIYRHILMATKQMPDADRSLPLYFKTTDEMLEEFSYLGKEKAHEVVVTNPNLIVDWCDNVRPVPHNLFAPKIENSVEDLKKLVYDKLHRLYGENPPELITKRVETEMHDIITCHYDVIYMKRRKTRSCGKLDGTCLSSGRGSTVNFWPDTAPASMSLSMSQADIDRAVRDAQQYAQEDEQLKKEATARDHCEQLIYQAEAAMTASSVRLRSSTLW